PNLASRLEKARSQEAARGSPECRSLRGRMTMKTQNRRRLAYLMSTALLAQGLAYAQDATTPQPEASSTLDDVIVTAQKKQESLQNVPISVDVVGGETLDRL